MSGRCRPSEPNPPFLLVVDVGHSFEVFADFTQAGKAYLPFPDPRTFRIRLEHLAGRKGPRAAAADLDPPGGAGPRAANPPTSPARFPPTWRSWPSRWKKPGTSRAWWRIS